VPLLAPPEANAPPTEIAPPEPVVAGVLSLPLHANGPTKLARINNELRLNESTTRYRRGEYCVGIINEQCEVDLYSVAESRMVPYRPIDALSRDGQRPTKVVLGFSGTSARGYMGRHARKKNHTTSRAGPRKIPRLP
jgi:hypothetical protein